MKLATHMLWCLLFVAALASACLADETQPVLTIETLPPSVVSTVPQCGNDDVDPSLSEISVTFSKDMKTTGHCWSWCYVREDTFPVLTGESEFLDDNRTCVLHVALEPETTYAIWVNVDSFQSFQDPAGHPAVPYLLTFETGPGQTSTEG